MGVSQEFCFFLLDYDVTEKLEEEIQSLEHEKKAILYDASEQLCVEFSKFVDRTKDRLRDKVTAQDLSKFVLTTLNCLGMDYPTDLSDKLNACTEAGDVLCELAHKDCRVIVFHNIDILELIIQKYCGKDDEDLRNYNVEFEKYLRRRICEHHLFQPDMVGTEIMSVSENAKVYIFMDSTWTKEMSLRKFYKLEKRLALVLQCRHIRLTKIMVGSLCFCYNILEKDLTQCEVNIEQLLTLINFGVKVLSEEIHGHKYSMIMDKACEYDRA